MKTFDVEALATRDGINAAKYLLRGLGASKRFASWAVQYNFDGTWVEVELPNGTARVRIRWISQTAVCPTTRYEGPNR
jgi:hypothetical protein